MSPKLPIQPGLSPGNAMLYNVVLRRTLDQERFEGD